MIPQAKFAIVKQAGHYPHLEQPTEFLTLVQDFLVEWIVSSNRHPALAYCWSMIFSENRNPLFGIML